MVRPEELADDPDRTDGLVLSHTVAETSRQGTTGPPSLASAEQGIELFSLVVDALVGRIEVARQERTPLAGPVREADAAPGRE
jgi:creatinine amidohydrolase